MVLHAGFLHQIIKDLRINKKKGNEQNPAPKIFHFSDDIFKKNS
jgi:hypothetical protein